MISTHRSTKCITKTAIVRNSNKRKRRRTRGRGRFCSAERNRIDDISTTRALTTIDDGDIKKVVETDVYIDDEQTRTLRGFYIGLSAIGVFVFANSLLHGHRDIAMNSIGCFSGLFVANKAYSRAIDETRIGLKAKCSTCEEDVYFFTNKDNKNKNRMMYDDDDVVVECSNCGAEHKFIADADSSSKSDKRAAVGRILKIERSSY
jgi:RNase P subunit RPR2